MKPLSAASVEFRRDLLERLDRWTPLARFFYVDSDASVCVCPVCDGALTVRFAGHAARADLDCHRGCTAREVRAALNRIRPEGGQR